jgi:hypothetical protein
LQTNSPERAREIVENRGVDTSAGYAVTAAPQASGDTSSAGSTNVPVVSADSTDPRLAASAVNAYMAAFVDWDEEQWRAQIKKAPPVVQAQLDKYETKSPSSPLTA